MSDQSGRAAARVIELEEKQTPILTKAANAAFSSGRNAVERSDSFLGPIGDSGVSLGDGNSWRSYRKNNSY